jgi:threonine synthase
VRRKVIMFANSLKCAFCGVEHELDLIYLCEQCEGTLDVTYGYGGISFESMLADDTPGIWKYRDVLPIRPDTEPVTLGEGDTPFLEAKSLGEALGHAPLYIKDETANPTGSFKDRPLSVALTKARELRIERIVLASTGNTAVSAAAYSQKAGMPCSVYLPAGTPSEKMSAIRARGADVEEVEGTFSDAYERVLRESREGGGFNVTSTFVNPYAGEGDKTVAYEIYRQLGEVPCWILVPVGAGPLLVYCWKGFNELMHARITNCVPRMVAVQAEGCAPIAHAYEDDLPEVEPWGEPHTIAGGVADPLWTYPRDGTRTLNVVRESKGCALDVAERDIPKYVSLVADSEGISAEPAAVLSVAAIEEMKKAGILKADESVVSIVTGRS